MYPTKEESNDQDKVENCDDASNLNVDMMDELNETNLLDDAEIKQMENMAENL